MSGVQVSQAAPVVIAQLVEQPPLKRKRAGLSPADGTRIRSSVVEQLSDIQ